MKPGDWILFGKWSGSEVTIDGEELLIMNEPDVQGIIETGRPAEHRGRRLSPLPLPPVAVFF